MKPLIQIIYISSQKNPDFENLDETYVKKIKPFSDIELIAIKAENLERKDKDIKKQKESEKILDKIKPHEFVILCDERGERLSSEKFSQKLSTALEVQKKVSIVIGGAFGIDESVKNRAQLQINLSEFVLNHHVAKVVLLEQIYRSFTIQKGIPYHNA